MKFWNRLIVGLSALALVLSLGMGDALAASSKSKKKKEVKKKETKSAPSSSTTSFGKGRYVSGTNIMGRAGLLYGDTSDVAKVGQVEGSAHFTWQSIASGFSNLGLPFGFHFGAAQNLDLYAAGVLNIFDTPFGSSSGFGIDLGGKYRIAPGGKAPDFSVGGDVMIPTNGGTVIVTPRGTITYVLASGLLLNGDVGIHISSGTYASFSGGVGVPIGDSLTAMAEIGANQAGNGGSVLAAGVRAKVSDIKLQALLGIPLNGGGVVLGGGIILASH